MAEFVLLYRSTPDQHRDAMGSPEKAEQSLAKWRAWMKGLADGGHLKSPGQPLERSGKTVRRGGVTDGPYAEAKEVIGGFSIVEAGDAEEAARLASGCPLLEGGGSVEVRPVMHFAASARSA